jgi:bacillithiol system protein YtxJ
MSLLNKLFGNNSSSENKEVKNIPWKNLTSIDQLMEIKETSKTKTVAVFKHSTRCGISRMVLGQFEREFDIADNDVDLYYLDLLNYRNISDEIAARFQVFHQSPQLLVIKNGVSVFDTSHHGIDANLLKNYI